MTTLDASALGGLPLTGGGLNWSDEPRSRGGAEAMTYEEYVPPRFRASAVLRSRSQNSSSRSSLAARSIDTR